MNTNIGGQNVKAGFYWNRKEWEIVTLSGEGGTLPGDPTHAFVKIPILLMLAVAPLMGALYVVFLPILGFALLFQQLGKKVAAGSRSAATDLAGTVGMELRPGESYLAGQRGKKEEPAKPETTEEPKGSAEGEKK